MKALEETVRHQEKAGSRRARLPRIRPLKGRCDAPGPAQPLCSALQVIEKMEQVLEDKLGKRSKPLQNKPQGKPSMRESAPAPAGPAFLRPLSFSSTFKLRRGC